MKLVFLFIFSVGSLWAIYSGNPMAPELPADGVTATRELPFQPRTGYLGDYLLHTTISGNGECSGIFQTLTLGGAFYQKATIELLGGSCSMHVLQNKNEQTKFYASSFSAYGARIQAILKRWGEVFLGLSASGMLASPRIREQTIQGIAVNKMNHSLHLKTWQLGIALGKKNELLSPYIGVKIGDLQGKTKNTSFQMKKREGMFVGCSLAPYAAFVINLEARFIDEQSCSIAAYIGF